MNNNAAIGLQFLVAMLRTRDYAAIGRNKITDKLLTPEERTLLRYIREYFENRRTHGMLPPMDELVSRFPQLSLDQVVPSVGDVDQLAHIIHQNHLSNKLRVEAINLNRMAIQNPYAAMDRLRTLAYELPQEHERTNSDLSLADGGAMVVHELRMVRDSGGLLGLPWVWPELNRVTRGKRKGDLILFYGRPKCGKTHTKMADAIWSYECGYRVLWCNVEDKKERHLMRAALALKRYNYHRVTHEPTEAEIAEIEEEMSSLAEIEEEEARMRSVQNPKRFLLADISTPSELRSKIQEVRPDIVYVDTANELIDENGAKQENQRQKNIVRALRDITNDKKLGYPTLVVSVHANREGDKEIARGFNEIGGSDQWGRSCDVILRVLRLRDPDTKQWMQAMLPPAAGGREMVWDGGLLRFSPYDDMRFVRPTNRTEVMQMLAYWEEEAQNTAGRGGSNGNSNNRNNGNNGRRRNRRAPTQNATAPTLEGATFLQTPEEG